MNHSEMMIIDEPTFSYEDTYTCQLYVKKSSNESQSGLNFEFFLEGLDAGVRLKAVTEEG
jgi:hypothetical protein